jgi:CRISPR-associated protein Csc1
MIRVIKLTLLNHLFYYTEVSGGEKVGSTLTGEFLGDLALNYAFAGALRTREGASDHRLQPDYPEIGSFGFYCTVARPLARVRRTDTYIQNTLFTDGYPDVVLTQKSGSSPYKVYRQVQGLAIGNEFLAAIFSRETWSLPPIVRMGRQRETLVRVEVLEKPPEKEQDNFWLNAFSLKTVFDNLDPVAKLMSEGRSIRLWNVIEPYFLIQNLTLRQVQGVLEKHFPST